MMSLVVKVDETGHLVATWSFKFADTIAADSPTRQGYMVVYDTMKEFEEKVSPASSLLSHIWDAGGSGVGLLAYLTLCITCRMVVFCGRLPSP